jgi:hypothetical protein
MAGSQLAADTRNGEAVAQCGGRLRRFFLPGGLIVSAALSACGTPAAGPPPVTAAPVAAAEMAAPPKPTPAAAAPAAMRIPELPVLTGMGPAELVALLGEPDLRRREPPAELWQYRSADCVLDVFLYVEGGGYRVLRSATRNRHVLPPIVGSCRAAFDRRGGAGQL